MRWNAVGGPVRCEATTKVARAGDPASAANGSGRWSRTRKTERTYLGPASWIARSIRLRSGSVHGNTLELLKGSHLPHGKLSGRRMAFLAVNCCPTPALTDRYPSMILRPLLGLNTYTQLYAQPSKKDYTVEVCAVPSTPQPPPTAG